MKKQSRKRKNVNKKIARKKAVRPRILYWDTETSPLILMSWGLYNQNHKYNDVYQDWHFLSAQWRWEHEKKVHSITLLDDPKRFKKDYTDDYFIVKTIYDLISQADIIVAHNNDGFDWKKFTAKVIEHGLPPIRYPYMVDTLKHARAHGFTSNSLDALTQKLSLDHKLGKNTGLWKKAAKGDRLSIRKIETYGRGDIPALRSLYLKLRPYMMGHPNMNHFRDEDCCPNCGSTHFHSRGNTDNHGGTVNVFKRFVCLDCGKWFKGKTAVKKSNMR